ncbi:MAG: ribonuclease R, partial [Pseudomonadota bacterium]
ETGADGLLPVRSLGDEFFHHDADTHSLVGDRSGQVYTIGQRLTVRLVEAVPVTGGLLLDLVRAEAPPATRRFKAPRGRGAGPGPRRKLAKGRIAKAKAARKERRKR